MADKNPETRDPTLRQIKLGKKWQTKALLG